MILEGCSNSKRMNLGLKCEKNQVRGEECKESKIFEEQSILDRSNIILDWSRIGQKPGQKFDRSEKYWTG